MIKGTLSRLPDAWVLLALFSCLPLSVFASPSRFDDLTFEAHSHVNLDYGGKHPFEQRRTQEYDVKEDATQSNVHYSTRDSSFHPIRIQFDTTLLRKRLGKSEAHDAVIAKILASLPVAADQWARHLYTVPVKSEIAVDPGLCFGIYGDQYQQTSFSGADLVIVVSGQNELIDYDGISTFSVCAESTLALGSACTLDQFDRPIVGFINFCLDHTTSSTSSNYIQSAYSTFLNMNLHEDHIQVPKTEVAVHELGHVMGFTSWMFKYFRKPDGTPRTQRPFQTQTFECAREGQKTGVLPSSDTIIATSDAVTGKRSYHMVTPRVKQVAQNLLNCPTVVGARLAEGNDCIGSHWHERWFMGELMSPVLTSSSENVLSPLTLALMEDTGWYRVDYRGISVPVYGLNAGCDFATDSCIQNDRVPDWGRDMFCTYPMTFYDDGRISTASLNHVICDPSHRWWTLCDLWDAPTVPTDVAKFPESSERYFSNENLISSFDNADSCPIAVRSLGFDCTQNTDDYIPFYPGETVGAGSRCLVASQLVGNGVRSYRPACMATRCDAELGKVVILLNGASEHVCNHDDDIIYLLDGSLVECPRLSSICPHLATCPGGCSGRGKCDYESSRPVCVCDDDEIDNQGCYTDVNPAAEEQVEIPTTPHPSTPHAVDGKQEDLDIEATVAAPSSSPDEEADFSQSGSFAHYNALRSLFLFLPVFQLFL